MTDQNLQFNILPFDWPDEEVSFYFSRDAHAQCYRLDRRLFPLELERVLPGGEDPETGFVYTSFDRPMEDFVHLDIDLQYDNAELAKLYFQYKLHTYLKGLGILVLGKGFNKGVQVWVPAFKNHTSELLAYECFRLRVQVANVSALPELLIRYEREVWVCRQNVAQVIEQVPPALFEWLVVDNRLVRYADYVLEENANYSSALPVLNKEIRKVLGKPEAKFRWDNLYKKQLRYTRGFYSRFLDNHAFREVLPIHHEFLRVDPELVWRLPYTAKDLWFGRSAGLTCEDCVHRIEPYKKSPHALIHLFFIVHRKHKSLIETVKRYFFKGVGSFPGLSIYTRLYLHPQKDIDIIFDDLDNPLPFLTKAFERNLPQQPKNITYIAVYISPYGAHEPDADKRGIYYFLKKALLERGIALQVLEATKLSEPKVAYDAFLPGIAVAMLAKLGGVPWRLKAPVQHELVMGAGVYEKDGEHLLAVGMSFSNEGRFEGFECFRDDEVEQLAGFVTNGIKKYAREHGYPKRLVVHCGWRNRGEWKHCSNWEHRGRALGLFQKVVAELKFPKPIPVFFVNMLGVISEDVLAFDTGWEELMPYSGTVVKVGVNRYLLFNNMRYVDGGFESGLEGGVSGGHERGFGSGYVRDMYDELDGFPLPVKVGIDCTDRELLQDEACVLELLDQVHQWSRMYWRGVRQQNLPVSVRYMEMLARMVGHFPGGKLPKGGKRELWFL